ncbi:branched-chain amino acid transport system II carrier protein [Bacillus sp. S/N-304-OC-R1]|uniref:branched-chain amino acid transport system II carrier protein n=1 Tax=Bacillus sp. S/N-304-OC-R1 TaxID=2758034 RepID=UPI001C8D5A23|nr:branched-chain amino acid transport system II carrier protein [Bacillus sp. S/N-304-OC-R1]MBY0123428.1 branched-chain amino acid transport system II carrier protein [Bacillus sp. S/N-304-OC-R1]
MNKTIQHSLILGFALFAIYFGAGNLIFPPSIGNASGTNWIPALIGFCVTGIALPLLAVIAILNAGGRFEELTRPISPWFYKAFNLLLMVGIGMFVTIPRMAATTHELGVHTLFPQVPSIVTIVVFFAVSYYFAMDKSNVIEKIGKFLTPVLVIILLFIVGKGIFDPIGTPVATDLKSPFSNAFISAYQTGDVVTGIFCAPIFIAAILSYGYKGKGMRKIALTGTVIAGLGLLIVYGGLLYIGASGSGMFPKDIDSTTLVSEIVNTLLGSGGAIALSIAIALACLTSAIGVIAVIAEFLNDLTKNKFSYRAWVLVVCLAGIGIGSLGVEKIINYALPIFLALYPVAIVLVFLGLFRKVIPNPGSYRGAILLTFIVSVLETLGVIGVNIPAVQRFISILPFSANGFSWLVPAIIGFIAGSIIYKFTSAKEGQDSALVNND